jgi:hypothetical protein
MQIANDEDALLAEPLLEFVRVWTQELERFSKEAPTRIQQSITVPHSPSSA